MITATGLELRAGSRLLLGDATFRIAPGDRVGLVGRNGAGKTTLTRVLAGESQPAAGRRSPGPASVGYLPQDPRTGDLEVLARDRILSARGLDAVCAGCARPRAEMASADAETHETARCAATRGWRTEFQAAGRLRRRERGRRRSRPASACPTGCSASRCGPCPAASAAGSSWPGSCSLDRQRTPPCCSTSRPTTWTPTRSCGCATSCGSYKGGLVVISHDVGLLEHTVNRVFHLDANRAELDIYNVGWKAYLAQRETDERRRKRERANAEKQAVGAQGAGRPDALQGHQGHGGAEHGQARAPSCWPAWSEVRRSDKVAKLRFPEPAPCGRTPLTAEGLSKSYGSLEVFTDVDLAIDRGSRVVILGLNGAGKTTLLRLLAGVEQPDTGEVRPGHGLKLGYYAQEHETLDPERTVLENMRSAGAGPRRRRAAPGARARSCSPATTSNKPAAVLSGGEKTRLALATLVVSSANVLMLDEPTNNLDPASREEILGALRTYAGAVVLVTHDEGAVEALAPERLILLPGRRRGPLERRLRRPRRPRLTPNVRRHTATCRFSVCRRTKDLSGRSPSRPQLPMARWGTDDDHGARPTHPTGRVTMRRPAWPSSRRARGSPEETAASSRRT